VTTDFCGKWNYILLAYACQCSSRGKTYLVALIDQLMSSGNQLQPIDVIEFGGDLVSEEPACTTGRYRPGLNVLRIGPDQITESTLMRDLLSTCDNSNLINSTDFRAETTVDAEHFAIDDSGKDQEVEHLAAGLPNGSIAIFLLTFLIEAIDLGDLTRLMVATDEGDLIRITKMN
jgi:hypothetical protein